MSEHRILVIEDQEDIADVYRATLRHAGYRVTNAYTGEEGVAEFAAKGADAVLLDMTLPEMHGMQVLEKIRSLSASVPVVVVTGESHRQVRAKCESLGVHEYLTKPPDYDQMLAAIKRSLGREKLVEEYRVVSLRLPAKIVSRLVEIDSNLERAITRLVEQRA